MVTSTKLIDKMVVKMAEQNNITVVPQRTLLEEVNEHITCPLCNGYYIDATTIVECLHSFCRSCIIEHLHIKSYCPVCEMMINSAKPNIKPDKALQDIVYKLVPGLFQREMERRQQFYASRPGPAASATPEQRGEDTERIIFSPEDVISFSLEYDDATDTDSISSKSSDSNEPQPQIATVRRFLQCPAVVNISHLKKFLSMKFDVDNTQFVIDILYKRVPLPDYYTLMDIAYIYNWKRNEPMRFFYHIIDYAAIRNRLFERRGTHFQDRKSSPASTEDTLNLYDQGSRPSSGTGSPVSKDNGSKRDYDIKKNEKSHNLKAVIFQHNLASVSHVKKSDDEIEKSQFLNSFELTAKNSNDPPKTSPNKNENGTASMLKKQISTHKIEDNIKRKQEMPTSISEMKRLKVELEKAKFPETASTGSGSAAIKNNNHTSKIQESCVKSKYFELELKALQLNSPTKNLTPSVRIKEVQQNTSAAKQTTPDSSNTKRFISYSQTFSSSKKNINESSTIMQQVSTIRKTVSPSKLREAKSEAPSATPGPPDVPKSMVKKIPDLKLHIPLPQPIQNKTQTINKVRMDLLSNNCDPTMDRSKIFSQVKSSMSMQTQSQSSGDPLISLFNSCNINIPSSLSITLTDQKQDPHYPNDDLIDSKKNMVNKNLSAVNSSTHKTPSPPVHNYIEILKLPDSDPKIQSKSDITADNRSNITSKTEPINQPKLLVKSSESSIKGPVPNLKPIADAKLAKQSANISTFGGSITFQQTFEQQLHSMQSDKKPKSSKNKTQVPKLVPASLKTLNAVTKLNNPLTKLNPCGIPLTIENKTIALDLSTTAANTQSHLTAHQTKAFETMQSIANLAKKQNPQAKGSPVLQTSTSSNRPLPAATPLRLPTLPNPGQSKQDTVQLSTGTASGFVSTLRQEISVKLDNSRTPALSSPYQFVSDNSPSATQPSPHSQTRSPSCSPKLVIAEEKQSNQSDLNMNQSNQLSSIQASSSKHTLKSGSLETSPSKPGLLSKPLPPANKITGPMQQPLTPTVKLNPNPSADFQYISAHHAFLRHMEMNAWLKAHRFMANIEHQPQNDINSDN